MKKIILTLLATSYLLVAQTLPNTITTTITNISNNGEIKLANSVPKGRSGLIIHNYGNNLSAITHATISNGSTASVLPYQAILHENIPNVKTNVAVGDKVVFGNFYENALLIAPNQEVYKNITKTYRKTWIHPDRFALNLMKDEERSLTLENIKKFAQLNQIGLVLIVVPNRVLILDPISKNFLGAFALQTDRKNTMSPFYARFEQMDTSTFGFSKKDYPPYYQAVAGLK